MFFAFNAKPMIALLFARGRFGSAEAATISLLIVLLVPSLIVGRILGIIQLPFYANLTMLPTLTGAIVALPAYLLIAPLAIWTAGVYGLPVTRFISLAAAALVTYKLARAQFHVKLHWNRIVAIPIRVSLYYGGACLAGLMTVFLIPIDFFDTDLGRLLGPLLIGSLGLLASLTSALGVRSVKDLRAVLIPANAKAGRVE